MARSLLAILAPGTAVAACGGPKVSLRYHPKPGSSFHYAVEERLEGRVESGAAAALPVGAATVAWRLAAAVIGPREAGGAVRWTVETLSVQAPAEIQERIAPQLADQLAQLKSVTYEVVYDDRLIALQTQIAGGRLDASATRRLRGAVGAFAFRMPVDPVGKGDQWRAAEDFPLQGVPGADTPVTVWYTLPVNAIRVAAGDTTLDIGIRATFPGEPTTVTVAGRRLMATLTGGASGEQRFSLSQGAVLEAKMDGTIRVEVSIPGTSAAGATLAFELHAARRLLPA